MSDDEDRPKTRGDCTPEKNAPWGSNHSRPCPWASCRYNLATVYIPPGSHSIIGDWPEDLPKSERKKHARLKVISDDVETLKDSCALDVADRMADGAPTPHMDIAHYAGVGTKQGLNVIEHRAIARIAKVAPESLLDLLRSAAAAQDALLDGDPSSQAFDGEILGLSAYIEKGRTPKTTKKRHFWTKNMLQKRSKTS